MTAATPRSEQCTATSKRTHLRCKRFVIGGGTCRFHGGATKRATVNREARIAVAEARDMFADRFEAREWWEALPAAASLADQLVQALRSKVELAGTLTTTELEALAQLAERAARLQKLVQDSDLDSRRVRIAERQGQMVAGALTAILVDLGMDPTAEYVQRVVSTRLRELVAGREPDSQRAR